jgi:hypothetical protein
VIGSHPYPSFFASWIVLLIGVVSAIPGTEVLLIFDVVENGRYRRWMLLVLRLSGLAPSAI